MSPGLFCLCFLEGSQVFLCGGLVEQEADDQDDDAVDGHVHDVVQEGIDPGRGHGHVEEGLGHVLGPDRGAHYIVDQEADHAASQNAPVEAALHLVEEAGHAQDGVGDQIVAQNALPAVGHAAVKEHLQNAVGEADDHAGSEAPADAEHEDRQHGQIHGTAPGHFVQGQEAENLCQSDHDRAFAERPDGLMGCAFVVHRATSNRRRKRIQLARKIGICRAVSVCSRPKPPFTQGSLGASAPAHHTDKSQFPGLADTRPASK